MKLDQDGWLAFFGTMIVGFILAFIFASFVLKSAKAADGHTHAGAAGRFYSTWMMPDAPHTSCCDNQDCAPAASKFENGQWFARWTDDEEWSQVPTWKVEQERDTPDGRSHMCGRRNSLTREFYVFCFVRGGGA